MWGKVEEFQVNKFEQVHVVVTWDPYSVSRIIDRYENIIFPHYIADSN